MATPGADASSSLAALPPTFWNIRYEELSLGPTIAKGQFGEVARGTYYGAAVAVKRIHTVKDGSPLTKYVVREL